MKPIRFEDSDDLINICYDNVFKAVFTRDMPQSQRALSRLVSAFIGQDVSVDTITANEPPIDNLRDRQIRFDIGCKTTDGELINIEMSFNSDPFEPVRLEFYAGKLFTGQDIRGADKNYNDLKQAYQIAILDHERFFQDDMFFHQFEYFDKERSVSLGGRSRIITVELSKASIVADKPVGEMDAKELWAFYFRYLTEIKMREKINEIMAKEEGIAMASEVLMKISRDEIERARLMSEYKYEVDLQSKMVYAKREGRQEGRQERTHEVAKNLKDLGISVKKIASATSLSEEEINRL